MNGFDAHTVQQLQNRLSPSGVLTLEQSSGLAGNIHTTHQDMQPSQRYGVPEINVVDMQQKARNGGLMSHRILADEMSFNGTDDITYEEDG